MPDSTTEWQKCRARLCFCSAYDYFNDREIYSVFIKVSEILKILKEDGWYLIATQGSHRQFKHPTKSGRVTVPGKPSDDLTPGTQNSILKQANLKKS